MARLSEKFARHGSGDAVASFDPFEHEKPTYAEIPLAQIQPDPNQPRKDLGELDELIASIREHGVVQPLVVTAKDYQQYVLVTGERRFTAAREAGLTTVPALVRTIDEHRRLEVQLVENIHRKDLNPLEEAHSYRRLIEEFGLTQEELGRRLGKSQPNINLTLKLLELPAGIQKEVLTIDPEQAPEKRISKSVLQEIARQPTEEKQNYLWKQAKRGELTVKKAREHAGEKDPQERQASVKTMTFRYPIAVEGGTVTVSLEQPTATLDDVIHALEAALEGEKARRL